MFPMHLHLQQIAGDPGLMDIFFINVTIAASLFLPHGFSVLPRTSCAIILYKHIALSTSL